MPLFRTQVWPWPLDTTRMDRTAAELPVETPQAQLLPGFFFILHPWAQVSQAAAVEARGELDLCGIGGRTPCLPR